MHTNIHNPGAPDLEPRETALAALLQATGDVDVRELGQLSSRGGLRARMLFAARAGRVPASSLPASSLPIGGPLLGSWAVAACLLVAIGMGGFFLLHGSTPVADAENSSASVASEHLNEHLSTAIAPREDIVLREDGALSLFHDIETFGGLGVDPDDLLALGE